MKITDLIKQLNALKKLHGNVDVVLINGETGYTEDIKSLNTAHPLNNYSCYDRTKPATAVILCTWTA